ncbi:MAG: septum formation initiator family protein [Pseudomonadota bacterium]
MATRQRKNTYAHRLVIPVLCTVLTAYFLYHSTTGRYGLTSHQKTVERSLELQFELAGLEKTRDELSNRTALLMNGSLERDMLDEQIRYQLNMLHDDEIAVFRRRN